MKIDKEKLSKYFLIGIGTLILYLLIKDIIIIQPKFKDKERFTIAITYDYSMYKGGQSVFYRYKIKEHIYHNNNNSVGEGAKASIGKRFLVKYVEGEEDLSYLLLKYPVPDSVKSAPLDGWKELPEWAKNK